MPESAKLGEQPSLSSAPLSEPPPAAILCPACGAYVGDSDGRCWFCERPREAGDRRTPVTIHGPSVVPAPPRPEPPRQGLLQFSIGTLLLVTTLIAVCLGVSVAVPPLGIPLSIVAAGGLLRTCVVGKHMQRLGLHFSVEEKLIEFVISCGVMIAALGVGLLAIAATGCLGGMAAVSLEQIRRAGGPSDWSEALVAALAVVYVGLAIGAPIGSVVWVLWATRPR
jgi:hypothetical protein